MIPLTKSRFFFDPPGSPDYKFGRGTSCLLLHPNPSAPTTQRNEGAVFVAALAAARGIDRIYIVFSAVCPLGVLMLPYSRLLMHPPLNPYFHLFNQHVEGLLFLLRS